MWLNYKIFPQPLNISHTCLNMSPKNPVPITPLHFLVSVLNCVLSFVSAHSPSCGLNKFYLIKFKSLCSWSILECIMSNSFLSAWFIYFFLKYLINNTQYSIADISKIISSKVFSIYNEKPQAK